MAGDRAVRVGRACDDRPRGDGRPVFVDRRWPCGFSKARAAVDEWCKVISPSTELRQWSAHDPSRFEVSARRYRAEPLDLERAEALEHLRAVRRHRVLTLLTAPSAVLADVLNDG